MNEQRHNMLRYMLQDMPPNCKEFIINLRITEDDETDSETDEDEGVSFEIRRERVVQELQTYFRRFAALYYEHDVTVNDVLTGNVIYEVKGAPTFMKKLSLIYGRPADEIDVNTAFLEKFGIKIPKKDAKPSEASHVEIPSTSEELPNTDIEMQSEQQQENLAGPETPKRSGLRDRGKLQSPQVSSPKITAKVTYLTDAQKKFNELLTPRPATPAPKDWKKREEKLKKIMRQMDREKKLADREKNETEEKPKAKKRDRDTNMPRVRLGDTRKKDDNAFDLVNGPVKSVQSRKEQQDIYKNMFQKSNFAKSEFKSEADSTKSPKAKRICTKSDPKKFADLIKARVAKKQLTMKNVEVKPVTSTGVVENDWVDFDKLDPSEPQLAVADSTTSNETFRNLDYSQDLFDDSCPMDTNENLPGNPTVPDDTFDRLLNDITKGT